jgi:hypothetical protein
VRHINKLRLFVPIVVDANFKTCNVFEKRVYDNLSLQQLKSVASAEKYVVTDKQQPLTWKKKLQYITLFVGVAILLVATIIVNTLLILK